MGFDVLPFNGDVGMLGGEARVIRDHNALDLRLVGVALGLLPPQYYPVDFLPLIEC